MQIAACLPAILEKDGQHDGVELVVPLLRVVVHAAEELVEARSKRMSCACEVMGE